METPVDRTIPPTHVPGKIEWTSRAPGRANPYHTRRPLMGRMGNDGIDELAQGNLKPSGKFAALLTAKRYVT
jgi:hypothetical protein